LAHLLVSAGVTTATLGLLAVVAALTFAVVLKKTERFLAGSAAIFLGILGITTGLGIGVRWLMVDGLSWTAVLHVSALAGGVALVTSGISRLMTGRSPLGKTLVVVMWLLVVAVLVWNLTPAVLATTVPPTRATSTPADLGLEAEPVRYSTSDGVELFAWYIPPDSDGRTVVVRHGSGSTSADALSQAAVLARHGFGVLLTDARGHGSSGGRAMDFGWHGEQDIRAAIDYLSTRPEVDQEAIAVLGLSMGAEEAIGAIGEDPRVGAVVAEGTGARVETDKGWYAEQYGLRGRIQLALEWVQYSLADALTDATKPPPLADSLSMADPRPVLLIPAGQAPDEIRVAEHLERSSPGNVTIWIVPDAPHMGGLRVSPTEWEDTVISFLSEELSTT
jgi:pimeloyl-ACP methyl ester carboxylesterase